MKTILTSLFLATGLAGPVVAQDWEYIYSTMLGPRDFYNSSGTRLTDLCTIVQQDRANYHRFGIRDEADGSDDYFGSREARARIPSMCQLQQGYDYIRRDVQNGVPRFVSVFGIFGANGILQTLIVTEGAG